MPKQKYVLNSRGVYETLVWDGTYNADGSKHRKHVYSKKSSRDLELKVEEIRRKVSEGNVQLPSDIAFIDYARHWLQVKKSVREKNTRKMYSHVIEHFFSELGGIRLGELKHSQIQGLINAHIEQPRSCEEIVLTINQVLNMAVSDSYITRDQYYKLINDLAYPKYKAPEKRALTEIEKESLRTAAFTDRERAFVYIIYSCGLRRGEALALTPFDFKFAPGGSSVTINKTVIFDGNNPEVKNTPKSEHGFRTVPVPDTVAGFLKEYIAGRDSPYLFTNIRNGKPITLSSYMKMWKNIVDKMNTAAGGSAAFPVIKDLTAHIFRHNYCSNLCYQVPAISIKKIASLLGDTEKMVFNVYNHIIEEKEDVHTVVNEILAI